MDDRNTGFKGDNFGGERILELCMGTVVDRNDPEGDGRVRVKIPGRMEKSPWAKPKGGGYTKWGKNVVPPLDADVYVQFINGNPERPVYEPADHGVRAPVGNPEGPLETERFPEFEDPDVAVWGIGPFRLVIDSREGQQAATFKLVKTLPSGEETDVAWIFLNLEDNAIEIHADSAVGLSGTIVNVDAPAVTINERKVVMNGKPIN